MSGRQSQGYRGRGGRGGMEGRGGTNNSNYGYYEHDSRQSSGGGYGDYNQRRGGAGYVRQQRGRSYRGNSRRGGSHNRSRTTESINRGTAYEADGDICMSGESNSHSSSRYAPYSGRSQFRRSRNSDSKLAMDSSSKGGVLSRLGVPIGANSSRSQSHSSSTWHKITIPHGRSSDKEFLLKAISNICEVPFIPVNFHYDNKSAVFYVNDRRTADAIRATSRRITKSDGFKMVIVTRPSDPPVTELTDDVVQMLKVCMSDRYNPSTKCLDLKDLYSDPTLNKQGVHLALSRPNVMTHIMQIIQEYIPELTSLSLESNKLYTIKQIASLPEKAPALSHLNLTNNMLRTEFELEALKNMKLTALWLQGNPLCKRFKDNSLYVR